MQSQYAQDLPYILAELNQEGQAEEDQTTSQPRPTEEEILHAYPVTIGGVQGVLHTKQEIPPEYFTDSKVIDSQEDLAPQPEAQPQKEASSFLPHFLLILCFFLLLDNVSNTIPTFLTPTATITIIPKAQQISAHAVFSIPSHIFKQVSFTETGTSNTTGQGHQNATNAHGLVTFYNSLPQPQTIDAGTLITANNGAQIATDKAAYVPAGSYSGNGQATIPAHAINPGSGGNIAAGDVSGTCCREYILVRNNEPFTGGADARDFHSVTPADIQDVQHTLFSKINGELQRAQGQIPTTDTLTPIPCSSTVQTNHRVGDEASYLTVTVTQSCTIVTYQTHAVTAQVTQLLTSQALRRLGTGYSLYGDVHISITQARPQQQSVLVALFCSGTWIYQINEAEITTLISGKPRLEAIHQLTSLPGVRRVTITGIADNDPLPQDSQNIKFLVLIGL